MARTLLVAGTASHVGKSTVAAGLCRLLARRDVDVVPFKAQNMSNNARAVATPDGGWGEIGVSQYVQARAARTAPTTDSNPVLLKPRGEGESQLVVDGQGVGHFGATDYYSDHWAQARTAAEAAHERLAAAHDVIVAEGAGSVAEPNLRERDLANIETARFADADVLLVADIERGGAFASIVGSLELAPDDVTDRVCGVIITKFRGDRSVLAPAIDELEERTGIPVVGVLPYDDPGLPEEDSVSLPAVGERTVLGDNDGIVESNTVTVAVPRLPRISNFTDLEPLAAEPGVRVAYLPLDADFGTADAVVLPGTKNTVDDLLACQEANLGATLRAFDGPVVGICGGYQLLGERLTNATVEGTGDTTELDGFGLLPVETAFSPDKRVEAVTRRVESEQGGPLGAVAADATGYEIHLGRTDALDAVARPIGPDSAATDAVLGTYLHGLFENRAVRDAFVDEIYQRAGRERPSAETDSRDPYDAAADLLADHLDLTALPLPEEATNP